MIIHDDTLVHQFGFRSEDYFGAICVQMVETIETLEQDSNLKELKIFGYF